MMAVFWVLLGVIIVLFAVSVPRLVKKALKWWDWAWFGVGMLLFIFTLAFVLGSIGEGESTAALRGTLLFGLPTLIILLPLVRRWTARGNAR